MAEEHDAGLTTQIFYEVNKAQHFDFPHTNCDEYTDNELMTLYFKQSGFGAYCQHIIAKVTGQSCDLEVLKHNPQFINYVVAWMRLKFVAELIDPVRYARYFHYRPRPTAQKPLRLPREVVELYDIDTTEFYAHVDQLANKIQFRWIEMMLGWDGSGRTPGLDEECTRLNFELQTLRGRIEIPYVIRGVNPYDLAMYPFLAFHLELRRVLLPRP